MLKIALVIILTVVVSTGYGYALNRKLNFQKDDFVTPIGFAFLMMLLQVAYYPAMLFNWSSAYEHGVSLIIFISGLILALRHIKAIIKELLKYRTLWIILSFALFLIVFYQIYIDIAFSDSQMYLNYMSQNINIEHVNMFNLWTGEVGKEWDTIYLFQGYYHFGSFLAWLVNINQYLFNVGGFVENITIFTWGLSSLYALMSAMLIYDFAHYFKKDKWGEWLMLGFGLFYLNFFYWRVALAFYGNTFRTIYMAALLFYLYRYFKEDRGDFKWLCIIISFAGIAFSSSFLFIAFAIMYALMVFLFKSQRRGTIKEMADFVIPLLVYALASFYKDRFHLFLIGSILALAYYLLRNKSFMLKMTDAIEGFLYRHGDRVLLYGATLFLIVYSAIYYFLINPHYEYNYAHYFTDHQNSDMIKDYFFIYTGKSQNLVNILRWTGVVLLFTDKDKSKEKRFLKKLFLVSVIIFLNPLTTVAIAKLFASNVYYRIFDVIFNPLWEMYFIQLIIDRFSHKTVKIILSIFVIYMIIYCHAFSQINNYTGEYGYYLHREVMPKYKMSFDNYDAIKAFQDQTANYQGKDQLRIISHADGLRVFDGNAWVIFTPREYYYPQDRINDEFYEQARNHYPWDTYYETDFSSACQYIERFDVDYAIVEWFQNWDFDIEVGKCGELFYANDTFHLYAFK